MPLYVLEVSIKGNRHEDQPSLRGNQGGPTPITDHIERTFAAHGSSFATCCSDLQARLAAYTQAEGLLLTPEAER